MKCAAVLVFFLYVMGIVVFHMAPTVSLEVRDFDLDWFKVGDFRATHLLHTAVFLPWGLFGVWFVYRRKEGRLRRGVGWIAFGLVVAATAEAVQYWLPYRSYNLTDMAFNLAGVAVGSLVLLIPWPGKADGRSHTYDEQGRSGR